jgi:hypothetical protein
MFLTVDFALRCDCNPTRFNVIPISTKRLTASGRVGRSSCALRHESIASRSEAWNLVPTRVPVVEDRCFGCSSIMLWTLCLHVNTIPQSEHLSDRSWGLAIKCRPYSSVQRWPMPLSGQLPNVSLKKLGIKLRNQRHSCVKPVKPSK